MNPIDKEGVTTLQTAPQVSSRSAAHPSSWLAWCPLVALPSSAIVIGVHLPGWVFMWTLSFAIFLGLKWVTWWRSRDQVPHSTGRSLAYLALWPGMDAESFLDSRRRPVAPDLRQWIWACAKTVCGSVLLWGIAREVPARLALAQGWIGLFGLILLLHFGSFHLIALFWQAIGIDAEPIMAKPILSKTLSEFWGKRWNLGFRQLAHDLIFHPLYKKTGVALASLLVFLVSGLIHDLVISIPARGGYGLPTAYFMVQGIAVTLERSAVGRQFGLQDGFSAWIFTLIVTAAPAFWLFHPPFLTRVILPFMHVIRAL